MPKSKKHKSRHLTEAEIWDDSALIRSWDEAVAEYEYYHSIHASGEDVEEVLRRAEMGDEDPVEADEGGGVTGRVKSKAAKTKTKTKDLTTIDVDEDFEDGEIEDDEDDEDVPGEQDDGETEGQQVSSSHPVEARVQKSFTNPTPVTNPNPNSDQAQILENIKMAYWWAGYYSGLYERQQQKETATAPGPA